MTNNELEQVVSTIAMASTMAGMFRDCAIICALAEKGLLDPLKVAAWTDVFAKGDLPSATPETSLLITQQLEQFRRLVVEMATRPPNAGRA